MRAKGGEGDQFFTLADHEESQVAVGVVEPVRLIVSDWPCIDHSFCVRVGGAPSVDGLGTGDCGCCQHQELPPVQSRGRILLVICFHLVFSIFKHEARNYTPMRVVAAAPVDREDKP